MKFFSWVQTCFHKMLLKPINNSVLNWAFRKNAYNCAFPGMDLYTAIGLLKEKGILQVLDGAGNRFDLKELSVWPQGTAGVFLIHDLFQIRNLAGNFSEVALDIVSYSPDKVIFHSPVNPMLKNGPISNGIIKFVFVKEDFWNRLLFQFGRQLIFCAGKGERSDFRTEVRFPLFAGNIREIFLGAEGEVKIIKR